MGSASDGWPSSETHHFCAGQPIGVPCGTSDEICATGACVGKACAISKLLDGEICTSDNDCIRGKCGYDSFSPSSSLVCCASGATMRVSAKTSDGWPSTRTRYFCTDQPDGTVCGSTDALCASDACVDQVCTASKLASN